MLTDKQHNHLVKTFKDRMSTFGVKPATKKYLDYQAEFFIGAISLLDMDREDGSSSMSPHVYVSILRGDVINEIG